MVMKKIRDCRIVPVAVIEKVEDAVPTSRALVAGGIDVIEITFRTDAALASIKAVAEAVPEMLVGAGTVTSLDQCKQAVENGAKFIVSPGLDLDIVSWCVENDVAVTPGIVTPTEIMQALSQGVNVLKFFPSNIFGGLKAMKALSGPFVDISFIPTGGVNASNLNEYLAAPYVYAVGGSWVCNKQDIADNNFDKIESLAKEARAKVLSAN